MQNYIKSFQQHCLRKRIDGINLTLIKPIEDLEGVDEKQLLFYQRNCVYESLVKLKLFFDFDLSTIELNRTKAILNLTESLGIYIEIFFKSIDLFIILQFKGFFFTKEESFEYSRALIIQINETFEELFRITTVDIAQDLLLPISDILPDPTDCTPNIRYCFRHTCRSNASSSSNGRINTGFEIFGGRFKLIVYDKKEENLHSKNLQKREYYQNIFDQYPDSPYTRVELRLQQESCKSLIDEFYSFEQSENDFINACLSVFYKKHKLRTKKTQSKEKDFRRWPVHKNWIALFGTADDLTSSGKTIPDYLYTSRSKDIGKAMRKLMEAVVNAYPEKMSEDFFKDLFEMKCQEVIEESKQKIILREESKKKLQSKRLEIFERFQKKKLHLSPLTQLGIPIISPVERIHHENPRTCEIKS